MEEGFYICSWKKTKKGYEIWVVSKPKWKAEAKTFEEAEEQLVSVITSDPRGPCEATWDYDKPAPKKKAEAAFSKPDLVIVESNGYAELAEQPSPGGDKPLKDADDAYYRTPVCDQCGYTGSPRSEKLLFADSIDSGYDVINGRFRGGSNSFTLFSSDFLELLTTDEKESLQFRPVLRKKSAKKTFFELVGPAGLDQVGATEVNTSGWQCSKCGYQCYGHWSQQFSIWYFVAAEDLPNPLPTVFTFGDPSDLRLCMPMQRWQQIVGKPGARGVMSSQLGVVQTKRLERRPKLELR